jgi:hypothetical protein
VNPCTTRALVAAVLAVASLAPLPTAQELPVFTYRVGFWLHLHHFLYVLGRAENGAPDRTRRAVVGAVEDQAEGLSRASAAQASAWRAAVGAYAAGPSRLDAVFDEPLWRMTSALAARGDEASVEDTALPADVKAALSAAGPIYRAIWWPAHGRASRDFVDALGVAARLEGPTLRTFVTRVYEETWPADGFPVQVSAYANWAGAYSTGDRLLVVASRDPALAGSQALETVFHEAMHQWDDRVLVRLRAAAKRRGVPRVPGGLSHAMIFYTAGEAVRRIIPNHQPYAEGNGIWETGPFARFKAPLDAAWRPYLRSGSGLDAALDALIVAAQ